MHKVSKQEFFEFYGKDQGLIELARMQRMAVLLDMSESRFLQGLERPYMEPCSIYNSSPPTGTWGTKGMSRNEEKRYQAFLKNNGSTQFHGDDEFPDVPETKDAWGLHLLIERITLEGVLKSQTFSQVLFRIYSEYESRPTSGLTTPAPCGGRFSCWMQDEASRLYQIANRLLATQDSRAEFSKLLGTLQVPASIAPSRHDLSGMNEWVALPHPVHSLIEQQLRCFVYEALCNYGQCLQTSDPIGPPPGLVDRLNCLERLEQVLGAARMLGHYKYAWDTCAALEIESTTLINNPGGTHLFGEHLRSVSSIALQRHDMSPLVRLLEVARAIIICHVNKAVKSTVEDSTNPVSYEQCKHEVQEHLKSKHGEMSISLMQELTKNADSRANGLGRCWLHEIFRQVAGQYLSAMCALGVGNSCELAFGTHTKGKLDTNALLAGFDFGLTDLREHFNALKDAHKAAELHTFHTAELLRIQARPTRTMQTINTLREQTEQCIQSLITQHLEKQVAQHFQQRTLHFAAKTVAEKGLDLKAHTVSELIDLFGAPWLEKNLLYVDTEILRLVEQCTSMNDAQLHDFVDNCTAIARDEISQLTGWALRDCCHARSMDGMTPLISCNCREIIPETPQLTPAEESHAGIVQTYVGVLIPTCLHADVFSRQQPYEHLQQCSCTHICTLCHAV